MTDDVRDKALHFEAVKTSISQTKSGIIIRLAVHPDDCPRDLMTSWVGTRYMVAMVMLDDQDQPSVTERTEKANRAIASAGMLPRSEQFFWYLDSKGLLLENGKDIAEGEREMACVQAIRNFCKVQSRTEFRSNDEALKKFILLRDDFTQSSG